MPVRDALPVLLLVSACGLPEIRDRDDSDGIEFAHQDAEPGTPEVVGEGDDDEIPDRADVPEVIDLPDDMAMGAAAREGVAVAAREMGEGEAPRAATDPAPLSAQIEGPDVAGMVTLAAAGDLVRVRSTVRGLPAGPHAYHVHEGESCDDPGAQIDFATLFDGTAPPSPDGAPADVVNGNLGELVSPATGGEAEAASIVPGLIPEGMVKLEGKAVVVHTAGNNPAVATGAAGPRLACGILQPTARARGED